MANKKIIKKKTSKKATKKDFIKKPANPRPARITETLAIASLIINILILPGLGTIVGGRTREGVTQIILLFGSIFVGFIFTLTIIGAIIGIPLMFLGPLSAWIWGIVSGIQLIKESEN